MSYKLYGRRRSGSLIVELSLAEIGVDYEIEEIDLEVGAQLEDSYKSVNPHRKIPTLETPQGELLTESAATLSTLDERHPDAHLLPAPGSTEFAPRSTVAPSDNLLEPTSSPLRAGHG